MVIKLQSYSLSSTELALKKRTAVLGFILVRNTLYIFFLLHLFIVKCSVVSCYIQILLKIMNKINNSLLTFLAVKN